MRHWGSNCILFFVLLFICQGFRVHAQTAGVLYALTYQGGIPPDFDGMGATYDPITGREKVLFNLDSRKSGTHPYGNLMQAKDGLIYGMVSFGGHHGFGTILQYNITTGQTKIVYTFTNNYDAAYTYGTLLQANNGKLYGVSSKGGRAGGGTLFSFDPVTEKDSVLISLQGEKSGCTPVDGLIQASDSQLYVTTSVSKPTGYGTLFRYNILTGDTQRLITFTGLNGNYPRGDMLQAGNGLLYGFTMRGGKSDSGVLFSYNIKTGEQKVLVDFNGTNGASPQRTLIQASDSNLYGTTKSGGTYREGTIFQYNIKSGEITTLHNFNGKYGRLPYQSLIQATNGLIYGITTYGGTDDKGVAYSFNIKTKQYKVLLNSLGIWPYGDFLEAFSVSDKMYFNPKDSTGSVKIYARGGKYPLTYLWSNGETTDSVSHLKKGIYSCTVSDARGITFTISDSVKPPHVFIGKELSIAIFIGILAVILWVIYRGKNGKNNAE